MSEAPTSTSLVYRYDAGDVVFRENETGAEFFIVLDGEVTIRKQGEELARLGVGEFFGEQAIVDRKPRSATAVASADRTALMALDAGRFLHLVSQQPGFALLVMETLSLRARGIPTADTARAQDDQPAAQRPYEVVQIDTGTYQFRSRTRSCNAYLLKGPQRTVLVDTGLPSTAGDLVEAIAQTGTYVRDIDLIWLTHEHFDHTAAVPLLEANATVVAHRMAANKIHLNDEFETMARAFGESSSPFTVDVMVTDGCLIDTGQHCLRVLHTPGHSSGSASLIDERTGLLIGGDTVFKGGPLSGVFGSGNTSDLMASLSTLRGLKPTMSMPGHGPLSDDPLGDIETTIDRCRTLLSDTLNLFDHLHENDSVMRIIQSYKQINRSMTP